MAGDDVVVKLKTEMTGGMLAALIKEMVGQDESRIELHQFNPDITFAVPKKGGVVNGKGAGRTDLERLARLPGAWTAATGG